MVAGDHQQGQLAVASAIDDLDIGFALQAGDSGDGKERAAFAHSKSGHDQDIDSQKNSLRPSAEAGCGCMIS